jgi:hypothetical protein
MASGPTKPAGREIYVEFIVHGAYVKATAIDGATGEEASIVGPATAGRESLAQAAKRKLDYLHRKKGGA